MDERRLWAVVFLLLGLSAVLVLFAFQFPWFRVAVERDDSTFEANFYLAQSGTLDDYYVVQFLHEDDNPRGSWRDYSNDMDLRGVMGTTYTLLLMGLLGIAAFGGALAAYYFGALRSTALLYGAWVFMFLTLLLSVLFFTFSVTNAADNDARGIANDYGYDLEPNTHVKFWDGNGEPIGFGRLVSNPGASWFLALLALANVVGSTVVLFRFPDRAGAEAVSGRGETARPGAP